MELKLLEDFLALAETGSFSKAAQLRNVTQPAFSRRIRALETWLGTDLIDRSVYPTALTSGGDAFRAHARELVQRLHDCRRQLLEADARAGSTIRFAMPHSLALSFFPTWWRRLGGDAEACAAHVVASNYHDCVQLLIEGGCQFLLCFRHEAWPLPLDAAEFPFIRVGEERLLPVSVPAADGRPRFPVARAAEAEIPLLAYAEGAFLGRVAAAILDRHPRLTMFRRRYEDAFAAALRAQALAGAGLAWLPDGLVAADLRSGVLVEAGDTRYGAGLEVRLYRSARDGRALTAALWALAEARQSG